MRGGDRRSKSAKQLKADGTYRKDRHGNAVAIVPVSHLDPPEFYDAEQLDLWRQTVQSLVDFEILAKQHYDSIRLYVETMVMQRKAYKDITTRGATITMQTKLGPVERVNPSFNVYDKCDKILKPLREQFGFTPRALQGMKTRQADEDNTNDPTAEFFKGPPVKPRAEA